MNNMCRSLAKSTDPDKQVFPKAVATTVALVAVLYMMINISYVGFLLVGLSIRFGLMTDGRVYDC
jgi:hypothetical protein